MQSSELHQHIYVHKWLRMLFSYTLKHNQYWKTEEEAYWAKQKLQVHSILIHFIELFLLAFLKTVAAVKQAFIGVLGALTYYITEHSGLNKTLLFAITAANMEDLSSIRLSHVIDSTMSSF